MRRVANRKIIRLLSYRTMKDKRWKNLIAILAIVLTTLLFMTLFTVGGSMMNSMQEATMRQVGTSAHGGYKYLSIEEYEKVKAAGGYLDISYDIIAGFAVNSQLSAIQTEVRYAEDEMARWSFSYPEEGRMPKKKNECAASSKVLEALGIPLKMGEKVPLRILSHDEKGREKIIETEFVLCGFWYSNEASHAQEFWVSEEWLLANIPLLHENYEERIQRTKNAWSEGTVQAGIVFDSSFDIEGKMVKLTERAGLAEEKIYESVNWAYGAAVVDGMTLTLGIGLLFVIILSGYLIIYNIFYINVAADIRYYGLLKTIGTTGKQLRRMVRGQALFLSAIGIPVGLAAGFLVAKGILPAIYGALNTGGVTNVVISPLPVAGSVAFSLFVVYISCIKPCNLATGVSPVEAVRYAESTQCKKKEKRAARVTSLRLAMANLGRNKRKAAVVIASLSLSLILINGTYALVKGFSFDEYVKSYLISDMQVSHSSIINFSSNVLDYEAIDPEFLEAVKRIDGVKSVDTLYVKRDEATLPDTLLEKFRSYYASEKVQKETGSVEKMVAAEIADTGITTADCYYLPENLMPEVTISEGNYDREKFEQGGYAIVMNTENWLSAGDKIFLGNDEDVSGTKKELEIMAVGKLPYAITTHSYTVCGVRLLLSEKDFREMYTVKGGLHACIWTEEGKEEQITETVNGLIEQKNPELVLTTKTSLREEFSAETNMFSMIGGFLGFVLALIGILNFINAMVTGILARKQEFAMMQAVGMTGRQLRRMLTMEGVLYGAWTIGIAVTLGNVISYGLIYLMGKNMAYFEWSFHILPMLISIPVIAAVSVILPVICYHTLCRKSIIERIRLVEV